MSEESRECAKILADERMAPFWQEVDRIERQFFKDLRSKRDGAVTYAFDALDRVRAIPVALREKDVDTGKKTV